MTKYTSPYCNIILVLASFFCHAELVSVSHLQSYHIELKTHLIRSRNEFGMTKYTSRYCYAELVSVSQLQSFTFQLKPI